MPFIVELEAFESPYFVKQNKRILPVLSMIDRSKLFRHKLVFFDKVDERRSILVGLENVRRINLCLKLRHSLLQVTKIHAVILDVVIEL